MNITKVLHRKWIYPEFDWSYIHPTRNRSDSCTDQSLVHRRNSCSTPGLTSDVATCFGILVQSHT